MSENLYAYADGGVTAPAGFMAAGVSAGIKKSGRRDVALIVSGDACASAAVFTTSSMAAPPVVVSREHISDGRLRAIVVNAGNANACTGERGMADARAMAVVTAGLIGCEATDVLVASTGVIGLPMPMSLVLAGIEKAAAELDYLAGEDAAAAIMTTDTFMKTTGAALEVDGVTYTVGGMAKGSGMIQPNMATMLAFVTTDAPLSSAACDAALRTAVARTFNRITVDSDTSTNDMCTLMASGVAGGELIEAGDARYAPVAAAVEHVCGELARMVVRDGEGATKLITVTVRGAASESDAEAAAFAIANSPLVKTAIFGADANWGRVAMAIGKSSAIVDPARVRIHFAGILTCDGGTAVPFSEEAAAVALAADNVEIAVDLGLGDGEATVWTCDLSYEYVKINGEYRS
ncbi:MAG: bifunctional glutamate N-acetyltransferase/amino-acid acetyltransferase ArgJ [Actinomycetota bacterium]|nr:bifunctional glutamate N-acetyltransferase/amino-acid acetyltransferase ArgJ [Actinomycetota bacterium]MDP3629373.1 bifunctional glutamate N-acetyltransferase/amino-acid acetyltransferase ArgJ [Actinomycetota bacterium]